MVPRQHRSITNEQSVALEREAAAPLSRRLFSARTLLRCGGQGLVIIIPSLFLLLFIVYPLAAIILQSVFPHIYDIQPTLVPGLDGLHSVFATSQNYLAFLNSLWLGAITALLACVPLLPYGYAALDRLWAHLYEGAAWPLDAPTPAARPRGAGPLERTTLGL